ncbi:SLATT domain-containing protein [Pontibacillus sp. ALD_SL1]|uniref:SLATT domain-containing protein n=1 Tax=Pontibacillus sp. ALD_SL1 TaxID=2777185 RepID=UPI001A968B91|nr:SLATT domain-containing protein [Pontibacillus sp. ALD_SL1]QSS98751.1 SLATT domain-containing protein [Pontibacillus sp. ALD_SL1]
MEERQNPDGERYSGQSSHHKEKELLEAQIRECYGRAVYSHKTHEKCADILLSKNNTIKVWQIILSGITTGSFIASIFGSGKVAALIGAVISTSLLILNAYTKDFELVSFAGKHRAAANAIWNVREDYLSLITDMGEYSQEEIREKRDTLQRKLADIYENAPSTNSQAYQKAQEALKHNEELTFSEREIDLLLPKELRKNSEE